MMEQSLEQSQQNNLMQAISAQNQANAQLNTYMLDNADLSESLLHFLRGELYVGDKWSKLGEQQCNDFGAHSIVQYVAPFTHRNNTLSNYTNEQILDILKRLDLELLKFLFVNMETFDIKNIYNLSVIKWQVILSIYASYQRALNGQESTRIATSYRFSEASQHGNIGMKDKMMNKFGAFFGGQR